MRLISCSLLIAILASGCSIGLNGKDPVGHYILAHKDGYPIDRERTPLRTEEYLNDYVNKILAGIDQHVKEVQQKGSGEPARILIFIHGGLNTYKTGLERVQSLLKNQAEEVTSALFGDSSHYPVFINWNSSFYSSVYDDIFEIRRGSRDRWLGYATSPFKLLARAADGIASAPLAWWYMGDNWLDSFRYPTEREKQLRSTEGYVNEEFLNRIWAWANWPAFLPVRVVTQPIVQSFGTPAWDMMKRRADLILAKRLLPTDGHTDQGAAWILLNELRNRIPRGKDGRLMKGMWQTLDGSKKPALVEITLVGHSMGTIVIDRILQAFPDVHFKRVVYLASASSIEDLERFVVPYLNEHRDTGFWTISLFHTDEAGENEWYYFFVDRGSLLVWIDTFFENSLTPRQQRLGRYSNFEEYTHRRRTKDGQPISILRTELFPEADITGLMFKGGKDDPKEHGDFSNRDVFRGIMCRLDPGAFRSRSCDDTSKH